MKKLLLVSLVPISVTAISVAVIVPVVLQKLNVKNKSLNETNLKAFETFQRSSQTPFVNFSLSKTNTILQSLNSADINLFYNGAGAITTVYMQQLALLAAAGSGQNSTDKEVHYAMAPDTWEPQAKVNWDELTRILHLTNLNSSLINVHNDSSGRIVDEWVKIIKNNPTKKINIWWNSDHLNHDNGSASTAILDLTSFQNVNLQLLEDGASISGYLQLALTPQNLAALRNDSLSFDGANQYILPARFDNVRSWFTSPEVNDYLANFDFLGHFNAKDLPEALFNTRIKDQGKDTRLSTYWSKVSGNDWHKALEIMNQAKQEFPDKKNLLILGSYAAAREEEFIKYLYDKYHDKYNIFYKGHPGHMEHTDYINQELIGKEQLHGIYTFEPSIASEELTRDHYQDGIKFDKVATVGNTSALQGFPNYKIRELFTDTLTDTKTASQIFLSQNDANWTTEVEPWLKNII